MPDTIAVRDFRMVIKYLLSSLFILLALISNASADDSISISHELDVALFPQDNEIQVIDRISLSSEVTTSPEFLLSGDMIAKVSHGELQLVTDSQETGLKTYRVRFPHPTREFTVQYKGTIDPGGTPDMAGMPPAYLDDSGVYLDDASAWYPDFRQPIGEFVLNVMAPSNWEIISQGKRVVQNGSTRWTSNKPQSEIYLVGGPFKRFARNHDNIELSVYLLDHDPMLAERYLAVMGEQIELYSRLFGPYPYEKFAVLENRWQTGYGMPSFTLLGSRVIRLPFIPYTSLPHEILHNWWGNGVWVNYQHGNWSEGLTAYLADHLMKEKRVEGTEYRRKALERYANYAAEQRDFPLAEFRARHDEASQAIGYSKSLMLFHMLRRELGDKIFLQALREFWQQWQFKQASFSDLLEAFSNAAGRELESYQQFLTRSGAPDVRLLEAKALQSGNAYQLDITVEQVQQGPHFNFILPVAVTLLGEPEARLFTLPFNNRRMTHSWQFESMPLRLDIDPAFDVFRLLDERERPLSLGQLFGAPRQWLVLPTQASPQELSAWQALAAAWQRRFRNVEVIEDSEPPASLPKDASVWVLGWENAWLEPLRDRFGSPEQILRVGSASIRDMSYPSEEYSVVLMGSDSGRKLGFIGTGGKPAIDALARKLTHYSSFGRMVFDLRTSKNLLRESLSVTTSPLGAAFSDEQVPLLLPARSPLSAN